MIKATTNKGETKLEIDGTFVELMADTVTLVKGLYDCISEKDEHSGELFKMFIEDNKLNDMIFNIDEEVRKMDKEKLKKAALEFFEDLFS